jgi:hypothetical protein
MTKQRYVMLRSNIPVAIDLAYFDRPIRARFRKVHEISFKSYCYRDLWWWLLPLYGRFGMPAEPLPERYPITFQSVAIEVEDTGAATGLAALPRSGLPRGLRTGIVPGIH